MPGPQAFGPHGGQCGGGDDAAYLLAMDATHGLNEQVADLEANEDVV